MVKNHFRRDDFATHHENASISAQDSRHTCVKSTVNIRRSILCFPLRPSSAMVRL